MGSLDNAAALIIGIANYPRVRPLSPAVLRDAEDVRDVLVDPALGGVPPDRVRLLADGAATREAILAALAELGERARADSSVFLYLSCHGGRVPAGPRAGAYLLPHDLAGPSPDAIAAGGISSTALAAALGKVRSRKLLGVFDCCHAAGLSEIGAIGKDLDTAKSADTEKAIPALAPGLADADYEALAGGTGRVVMAAARADQRSWILEGARNSLFTTHLLDGLRGGVTSDDGLVHVFDLFDYVQPRVTSARPDQRPVFKAELEDNFPVCLRRGGEPAPIAKSADGYAFDVLLSFVDREPDAQIAWERIIPRLEQEGLRVAVAAESLRPGVPRVVEIGRAIEQARRTVVLLSPQYLAEPWSSYTDVLALTVGIEKRQARLVPARIAPVADERLPLHLRQLVTVDLAHPYRAARELDRLVRTLQEPLPASW